MKATCTVQNLTLTTGVKQTRFVARCTTVGGRILHGFSFRSVDEALNNLSDAYTAAEREFFKAKRDRFAFRCGLVALVVAVSAVFIHTFA